MPTDPPPCVLVVRGAGDDDAALMQQARRVAAHLGARIEVLDLPVAPGSAARLLAAARRLPARSIVIKDAVLAQLEALADAGLDERLLGAVPCSLHIVLDGDEPADAGSSAMVQPRGW